jgi:hypothetical protein
MLGQKKKLIGEIIEANLKRETKKTNLKRKERKEKEDGYAAPHVHSLSVMMKGHTQGARGRKSTESMHFPQYEP